MRDAFLHVSADAMAQEMAAELHDELGEVALDQVVKHLPAVPSVHEVRELLECAREDARDYLVIRLLYYTGVRAAWRMCRRPR